MGELWHFVKSASIRNRRTFLFVRHLSSVLFVRLLRTSRVIFVFNPRRYLHYKKRRRHTLLDCLRTPTCAPSTPNALLSCRKTFSWHVVFVENEHRESGGVSLHIKEL